MGADQAYMLVGAGLGVAYYISKWVLPWTRAFVEAWKVHGQEPKPDPFAELTREQYAWLMIEKSANAYAALEITLEQHEQYVERWLRYREEAPTQTVREYVRKLVKKGMS